jgi:hypothetical protein
MQFMMLVATDPDPDARAEEPHEIDAWFAAVARDGKWVSGDRLAPVGEAKTVRVRSGIVQVSDGPYTDAREVIVGFDILTCDSMDEAVAIAAKHPMARCGRIEVRAFWS